jgi:hypothetical protein
VEVVEIGLGEPRTLFAPGGMGEHLTERMRFVERAAGTKVGFVYEQSGHFDACAGLRRQAERDAFEVLAVADEHRTTRAVGVSRGARAVVGALADDPGAFERVALLLPPGGRAAGRYAPWLESGPSTSAEILVIGQRGDSGHPARVAETWADQLDAELVILLARGVERNVDDVAALLAEFLD